MNTLRRISQYMVKTVAVATVLVAAAVPVALAGTAGAATGPTLTCINNGTFTCPTNNLLIVGQGYSSPAASIDVVGTGFANDQAVGGIVTMTTTAPGVTFTNVTESSATNATSNITVPSSTTPGFYSVTLTDSNGSVTLPVSLGVDHGPQVTAVVGNVGTAGGASSTVQLTGSFLRGASVTFTGTGTVPVASNYVHDPSGATLSFDVSNAGTAGTFAMYVVAPWPSPSFGQFLSSYTVNSAPTAVTITSVSPSELGIPVTNPSTNFVTIHGTGFQAGAVLTLPVTDGVTLTSYAFVNSTTMTAMITVPVSNPTGQVSIKILNPDTTFVLGTAILGIGVPATNTVAGPPAVVAPEITVLSGQLQPGTATILTVNGSSTFPLTAGATVSVSLNGGGNASETVSGTVLSVDANNNARVQVKLPRYATTALTAAVTAPVLSPATTTLTVGSTTGMKSSDTVTINDGSTSQEVSYTGKTATTLTGVVAVGPAGTAITTHPVGAVVEFSFPYTADTVGSAFTISINNGVVAETAPVTVLAAVGATFTSSQGSTIPNAGTTVNPGSYIFNAYVPGFGFSAGSLIVFNNPAVTGTVSVVNGNTATLHVTVASGVSAPYGTLFTAAVPGQNAITLTGHQAVLNAGDQITVNADAFYTTPETFTVTSDNQTGTNDVVSVSSPVTLNHSAGATVTRLNAVPSAGAVGASISNGAGQVIIIPSLFGTITTFFAIGPVGTATASLLNVGQGASSAPETFTIVSPANGDLTASHWTASSATTGVTFGKVTAATASAFTTTISVAPGTTVASNIPVKITNGLITYTSTINVVAGPTLTSETAVPSLVGGATSAFVGIYGTNLVNSMTCATSDPNVTCAIDVTGAPPAGTDTATTRTISFTALPGALNGTDTVTLTDPTTFGAGTLAGAVTVTGQATVTSMTPTGFPADVVTAFVGTVTGTALPVGTFCQSNIYLGGVFVFNDTCTYVRNSATSATVTDTDPNWNPGVVETFTIGSTTSQVDTPGVTYFASPTESFVYFNTVIDGTTTGTHVAQTSAAVPFKLVGTGFLPGATVTVGATVGTVTVTEVTPNAIFGTLNVLGTAALGATSMTVTNTNGGTVTGSLFTVVAAPTITNINGVAVAPVLEGQKRTLTITGTGFYPGAVVTSTNPALGTFDTATVSNGAVACLANCTTLTVHFTPVSFSGSTPILDGLTITNPIGAGLVTAANSLSINPVPAVTGVYYVPTFTTNTEITITGTGFETGITASSANPDYTVLAVSSTPTTVTLLVTTDSAATAGTSSTITLTNPDGGSGTFILNGGPNPALATPKPHATTVHGVVHRGKTTRITISGTHFYGQPRITSNNPGTSARVSGDTGKLLTVWVTTKANVRLGVHTFTIRFANGEQTSVRYNQVK